VWWFSAQPAEPPVDPPTSEDVGCITRVDSNTGVSRADRAATGSVAAVLLALVVGGAGAAPLAGLLLLPAFGLGLYARRWLALAGRSRVGARSEDDVQRALAPLRA
jgi:hypothetical protein